MGSWEAFFCGTGVSIAGGLTPYCAIDIGEDTFSVVDGKENGVTIVRVGKDRVG